MDLGGFRLMIRALSGPIVGQMPTIVVFFPDLPLKLISSVKIKSCRIESTLMVEIMSIPSRHYLVKKFRFDPQIIINGHTSFTLLNK